MFISRTAYTDLLLDNAKLREESRVLNSQNQTLQTSLEWFMVRITQLEKERAVLIENYMGVKIEVPAYHPPSRRADEPTNIPDLLGHSGFGDMGDEAAKRLGIGWDQTGAVVAR